MELAFSFLGNLVYSAIGISLASFFMGYMVLGSHLKKKGYRKTNVEIICSAATVVCLAIGFSLYRYSL